MFGYKQRIFKSMSQQKEINVDVKIRQPGEQPVCFKTGTVYLLRALGFTPVVWWCPCCSPQLVWWCL